MHGEGLHPNRSRALGILAGQLASLDYRRLSLVVSAGFFQTSMEILSAGPGPVGFRIGSRRENLLIFFAFGVRPGFDECDQVRANDPMSKLQPWAGRC